MRLAVLSRPWLRILLLGVVLSIASEEALRITGDANFIPTVILLGAFVIPVTFVAYFMTTLNTVIFRCRY